MRLANKVFFQKIFFLILSLILLLNPPAFTQVFTRKKSPGDVAIKPDSTTTRKVIPDQDRDDIPFIDYKPAVIRTTPVDTLKDFAYIRRNFTDQLLSVWSVPGRYYPASRIYAAAIENNYYRSCQVSGNEYVFAQQMVKGSMNLYIYRIIPQTNGWVEMVSHDPENGSYTNHMIVESRGMRAYWKRYGYKITLEQDSGKMIPINRETLMQFSDTYLKETPEAYKYASKFFNQRREKILRDLAVGMVVGAILINASDLEGGKYYLMASFPLAITLAIINKANAFHLDDMVKIVELYNREKLTVNAVSR
jgi:hypothetical protein